uniref:Uncharacterized protein n=2 Tax=Aegilops tauschii subsp. strangulata TaxID=200361 RepID=A0A453J483_AEGTS
MAFLLRCSPPPPRLNARGRNIRTAEICQKRFVKRGTIVFLCPRRALYEPAPARLLLYAEGIHVLYVGVSFFLVTCGGRGLATRPCDARKLSKTSHPIKGRGTTTGRIAPTIFPQIASLPLSLPHRLPLVSIAPPPHLLAQPHRLPLSGGFS